MKWYQIVGILLAVYGYGYLFAGLFSRLNRRLSWVWFKGITKR